MRYAAVLFALIAAQVGPSDTLRGYASAYAPGVMDDVVRTRFDNDWWPVQPPRNWYEAHGQIAAMDCRRVGEMATLIDPDGREYWVLIADCAGPGDPERFSRDNIIVELDARLFERLTERHGRPLEVWLR